MKKEIVLLALAWVLWTEVWYAGHRDIAGWTLLDAYETKAECERDIPRVVQMVKSQRKNAVDKGQHVTDRDHLGVAHTIVSCFPDTIDPREKR